MCTRLDKNTFFFGKWAESKKERVWLKESFFENGSAEENSAQCYHEIYCSMVCSGEIRNVLYEFVQVMHGNLKQE